VRIWSIHPKYLDAKGLVALWRETLLAKHVLLGNTNGYKNHPQLIRFKNRKDPVSSINQYLSEVYKEALIRGYNFDKNKIDWGFKKIKCSVIKGQFDYELKHLLKKLKMRDKKKYKEINLLKKFDPNPMFKIVAGEIENWEIIS
jgi:hypothetical protein